MLTSGQGNIKGNKPSYTKSQAARLIRSISNDPAGSFRSTKHARDMMKDRKISTQDIRHVFKNGKVLDEPEIDIKTGNWKYRIIGNGIDNDNLTVVVVINNDENYLGIITVF